MARLSLRALQTKLLGAALLFSLALVFSCSGNKEEEASQTPAITQELLELASLQVSDLPDGWMLVPPDSLQSTVDASCGIDLLNLGNPAAANEVYFQQSAVGPFFFEILQGYEEAEAIRLWIQAATELEACSETRSLLEDGSEMVFQVTPIDIFEAGDEVLGLQVSQVDTSTPLTAHLVLVRSSEVILVFLYLTLGGLADIEILEDLIERAVAKLDGVRRAS